MALIKFSHFTAFSSLALVVILLTSCSETATDNRPGFDRRGFLTNYTDNLILPSYNRLADKTDLLKAATDAFTASPSQASLNQARAAWSEAYLAWQYCSAFAFGPAELPQYGSIRESLGTFPVAVAGVENDIAQGNLNLTISSKDRRGFLTVEYLLFGMDSAAAMAGFLGDGTAANRRSYLKKVIEDIHAQVHQAKDAWISSKTEFILNDGTDAGSSTSALFNAFVLDFEGVKNFKLGLPLGLRPGQTQAEPQRVEAYYSGQSVRFMREHLRAIDLLWKGNAQNGQAGFGFDDYLETVVGGPELIQSSTNQYAKVLAVAAILPEAPLSAQIQQQPDKATALHMELQKQTRYFKSELSSLLGIAITFQSGDGD